MLKVISDDLGLMRIVKLSELSHTLLSPAVQLEVSMAGTMCVCSQC